MSRSRIYVRPWPFPFGHCSRGGSHTASSNTCPLATGAISDKSLTCWMDSLLQVSATAAAGIRLMGLKWRQPRLYPWHDGGWSEAGPIGAVRARANSVPCSKATAARAPDCHNAHNRCEHAVGISLRPAPRYMAVRLQANRR